MTKKILRPALRYHGGKWRIAPWIIEHLPPHRVYVEPFGGAASVLIRKPPSYAEVYNDLDGEVVNLFSVLRDEEAAQQLVRELELTPFARDEYREAHKAARTPVEMARRLIVRSFMGFGSDSSTSERVSGFRSNSNRSGSTPAQDWTTLPPNFSALSERFRGVVIENKDALEVMSQHDSSETLHYVDPPYVHSTRSGANVGKQYRHELTHADHVNLLSFLCDLEGAVVLSGYRCEMYDEALEGWRRIDKPALADGARYRVESIWLNAAADPPDLFR